MKPFSIATLKQLAVALGTLILAAASTSPAFAADTLWQVKGTGRSAEAQFATDGGSGRVNLFQTGGTTFLFYEIRGNDPTSEVCQVIIDQDGN